MSVIAIVGIIRRPILSKLSSAPCPSKGAGHAQNLGIRGDMYIHAKLYHKGTQRNEERKNDCR